MNAPSTPTTPAATRSPQAIALGAMFLAVVAAVAIGRLGPVAAGAGPEWLQQIETAGDHIDADELARELLAGARDVALVDLRPAAEYAVGHLLDARNLTVPEVCGPAGAALFAAGPRLVVLYSNGPTHPGQAWVELRRQGRTNVRVLDGGLTEFQSRVLTPPSLRDGIGETEAKAAGSAFALQRAFFLGDPRPNPLATWATDPQELAQPTVVSPHWLGKQRGRVAVLDVRRREDFAALHLPGAHHLDLARLRVRSGDRELFLRPPTELADVFGSLGITATTPVVLCADDKLQDATLAAVALLRLGHRALAILEGGVLRWATERLPLVATTTPPVPAVYSPDPAAGGFAIGVDELATAVQKGAIAVLDVRPPEFFRGEKSTEARPGHIPGAHNRPFQQDLARTEDGTWFRPRAELEREFAALGLRNDEPLAVSCRTGHTASETFFVLHVLLGRGQVRWYNGSWTEWAARQDLPAATGER